MALAPTRYTKDIKHAFLVLSEPSYNPIQFPSTHSYTQRSQIRFDPPKQLQKTIHAQQTFLSDCRFVIADGFFMADSDWEIGWITMWLT